MGKVPMNFRMEDELVKQLKKIAEHENRSLTNLIETELKKFVQNHSIIISLEHGQKKIKKE
jgi:predicted transcriptional regulator